MRFTPKIKEIDHRLNVTTYHDAPKWYRFIPVLNRLYYVGITNKNDTFRRTWRQAFSFWFKYDVLSPSLYWKIYKN